MIKTSSERFARPDVGVTAGISADDAQRLLGSLFADAATAYALLDPDFGYLQVNEAFARARGKSVDYFPGKDHFDLHPSDAKPLFEKARDARQKCSFKARPLPPAGSSGAGTTYWDGTVHPVLGPESAVEALFLMETEVSDKVREQHLLFKSSRILAAIAHAQDLDPGDADREELLDQLLAEVISLTESEYGLVGELHRSTARGPCLRIQTVLDFTPRGDGPAFGVNDIPGFLELRDPNSLLSEVMTTGRPVAVNDPAGESRDSGLPDGHPSLRAFLGLPLMSGKKASGVICVANSPEGYDSTLAEFLRPLLRTYLSLMRSLAVERQRSEALTTLQESEYLIRDLAVPAVENEHEELIELINECYEQMHGAVDPTEVRRLIEQTYSEVAEHFQHEEQLMRSAAYPDYRAHKESHDRLLTTLRGNIDRFAEDPDHDVHILQRTLAEWFGRHFSTHDLRLNRHFAGK